MPDLVYYVKAAEYNEELRYSLRSISENLPDASVTIVGYKPSWVSDVVRHIPTVQLPRKKHENARMNIRAALDSGAVSDPFWMLNDDMFLLRPVTELPLYDWGPVADVLALGEKVGSVYHESMKATYQILLDLGYENPISYAAHVPDLVFKAPMKWAMDHHTRTDVNIQHATIQGNIQGLPSVPLSHDVKIYGMGRVPKWVESADYVSTSDKSFMSGWIGDWIRKRFSNPSVFEI